MRMMPRGINKRVVESLIKAGAFDSLPGSRRQKIMVHTVLIENTARERKDAVQGQMSLFDMPVGEEELLAKEPFPDVAEYQTSDILAFEKEVLGIYISGHPLDAYDKILEKNVTADSTDFISEEEAKSEQDDIQAGNAGNSEKESRLKDQETVVVGGIIAGKTLKTTKSNTVMAFLTIEDMYGTLEVLVFPKDLERHRADFEIDRKVLIRGRFSLDEERGSKLLFSDMVDLDSMGVKLWVQFPDNETYKKMEDKLLETICRYDGNDPVIVYTAADKQCYALPNSKSTDGRNPELIDSLKKIFGEANVRTTVNAVQWEQRRR